MLSKSSGDRGYYGAGIYFGESSGTAMGYCGGNRLLLCVILTGNEYMCKALMNGHPKVKGYDSHIAPGREETVIFDDAQILPCYILTLGAGIGAY